jgi:hypothetical protein
MAERVVVGLEAVEVEQHQDGCRAGVQGGAEIKHQLAPVSHAREGIRLRFDPGRRQQQHLLAEGEGHPGDHRQHRGGGEDGCGLVQRLELPVHEDSERGEAEDGRQRQDARALGADRPEPARRLPGRGGEQEHCERPAGIQQVDAVRRAHRCLVEDAAVGERERGRAAEDAQPGPVELPAGDREDGDDEAEQQGIRERVREVHRRSQRRASRALDDRAEEDRGADCGNRQRRKRRVQPEAALEVHGPGTYQEADPRVEDRIGHEPQPVGDRRRRHRRIQEEERVVEVAGRPQQKGRSDAAPGRAFLAALVRRGQADECRPDEQDVVEPPDELGRPGRLGREQHEIDRKEGREAEKKPPAACSGQGWI